MKKFLMVLLVIGLGIFGAYYYVTLSMVNVANDFFKSVKAKNMVQAETYLSKGFKKNTSLKQLEQYLVNYKLNDYQKLSWGYKRIIDLNTSNFAKNGSLEGTIVSKNNVSSPLKLQFKQEAGVWKLFTLEKVLSKEEIAQQKLIKNYTTLARISLHTLGLAVKENNMSILYNDISKAWQKETNATELNKAYGVFVKKKVNFAPLDKVSPTLTSANVAKNGLLTLQGYYPLGKQVLSFKYDYLPENKIWKLAGLSLQFK